MSLLGEVDRPTWIAPSTTQDLLLSVVLRVCSGWLTRGDENLLATSPTYGAAAMHRGWVG